MAQYGPKQTLSQKLQQKLSPQQIQLMKLLQIPTATLEQRIQEELEINPALEEGDETADLLDGMSDMDLSDADLLYYEREQKAESGAGDLDGEAGESSGGDLLGEVERETSEDYADEEEAISLRDDDVELDDYLVDFIEDDPSTYKTRGEERNGDEENKTVPLAFENTFHEYLEQQLGLLDMYDERENAIALQVIGSIDDDGYLRREPRAMVDDLLFSQNIQTNEKEILQVLARIQQFDPPGIGARDLQECLLLQLRHKLRRDDDSVSFAEKLAINVAIRIIDEYFDEFTKKHYPRLCRQLEIDEEDLKEAVDEILKLNPKPASGFASRGDRAVNYVLPDYIVSTRDGELELSLNARNAPDLRINDQYRDMLKAFHSGRHHRRHQTAPADHDAHHGRHPAPPTGVFFDGRPEKNSPHDPQGHCRRHRSRHFHRVAGGQFQICANRIRYQTPQGILFREPAEPGRRRGIDARSEKNTDRHHRRRKQTPPAVRRKTEVDANGKGLQHRPAHGGQVPRTIEHSGGAVAQRALIMNYLPDAALAH
jgi:RNA polymerase sigma-54 factor